MKKPRDRKGVLHARRETGKPPRASEIILGVTLVVVLAAALLTRVFTAI
ncbi:hypothetical protein [Phyllobacterium phragmitis]|nr:hypothetical protein [Phyllobacterium phragmitis]